MLDLADVDPYIVFLSDFGLVLLFFLAGIEVIHNDVPRRLLARGTIGWGISLVLGATAGFALEAAGVEAPGQILAVALATTTLGTLVPILSDSGMLRSPLGQNTLGSAVAGEFWPIVVISLFLTGAHATAASIVLLIGFGLVVVGAAGIAVRYRPSRILAIVSATVNKSAFSGIPTMETRSSSSSRKNWTSTSSWAPSPPGSSSAWSLRGRWGSRCCHES